MKFTGIFQDCAADILDVWGRQLVAGVGDPEDIHRRINKRLRANMILSVTDTTPDDPSDYRVRFLHRFSIPSKIIAVEDPQRDQAFSEFSDQEYLRRSVIPAYARAIEGREPSFDQVTGRVLGFRILYDRLILPEPRRHGRVRWCMSLTETRFALQLPFRDPGLDDEDVKVLQLLREGDSAREIAEKLGLSRRTIEGRVERLKKRFKARNVAHLITLSISHACDAEMGSAGFGAK